MQTLFTIPRQKYVLACSGGSDSMAALAFLMQGRHDFTVAHFHHGTEHGNEAIQFVSDQCQKYKIPFSSGYISGTRGEKESPEEYFRRERYDFLKSFNCPVITGHHLDDCVETWIFSSMHGTPKLIPYQTDLCLRPFLTSTKRELELFAIKTGVQWIEDRSNGDTSIPRNFIRHQLIPMIQSGINKNIHSTIKKRLVEKFQKFGINIKEEDFE